MQIRVQNKRKSVRKSRYVGDVSVRRRRRCLATARLYTQIYEFRPLSEEVIALRLGAAEACRLEYELQGVRTLVKEGRGGLYRVCQPLAVLGYTGVQ